MASKEYNLVDGGIHDQYDKSRAKIQFFGGGFGNGKTAASVVLKAMELAKQYPGSNGLIARSTYPKLNDTIRKEFIKWIPKQWIKSFPKSQNGTNTCTLKNGTEINFRYVEQQGKSGESSTSNLLSATYDWIIVDQIEDPEIVYKDFLDLLGRLRGNTPYIGDDPTMPQTGPRWFCITSNPTRNWVFTKLIKPVQIYETTGRITEELLCKRYTEKDFERGICEKTQIGNAILDSEGKAQLIIDIFEGSTYENETNLGADFIETLENTYRGQMRERFLMGKWGAYEGLIYMEHDESIHAVPKDKMVHYLTSGINKTHKLTLLEGYDHGLAMPACYLLALVDYLGMVFIIDGFYLAELTPEKIINNIKKLRMSNIGYNSIEDKINADPSIFRRGSGEKKVVGVRVCDLLFDKRNGVNTRAANNDIINGITKVQNYMNINPNLVNPFTCKPGSPLLFYADHLTFISDEIGDYYWKKDSDGDYTEKPRDKNDHAMDTIKYMLSTRPKAAEVVKTYDNVKQYIEVWHEHSTADIKRNIRHG